jgi:chromosome segregation ATPase
MSKAQTAEKTVRREPADKAPRRDAAPAPAPSVPDERDAAIARLERTLVEERQIAAQLRDENDALRFKGDVLEKSYSKQLADARQRNDALQKELDAHKSRFAELGTGAEDTLRLLADTRAELNRVTADLNMLRAQQGRTGGMPVGAHRQPRQAESDDASSQTINALLSGAPAARGREGGGDSNLHQRVKSEQAAPLEEMLPPDLIFTKDDDDKKSR